MALTLDKPLASARLLIRPVEAADLPALLVVNGDDAVTVRLPYVTWKNMDDARTWYARMCGMQAGGSALQMVLIDRQLGHAIGSCLLFRYEADSARAELGYVLGRAHWGQGYMREALRAVINCAFEPLALRRLEAEVDPRNVRSARLLEQLRFTKEGLLRQRWLTKGEPCDINVYGLLRHEWQPEN